MDVFIQGASRGGRAESPDRGGGGGVEYPFRRRSDISARSSGLTWKRGAVVRREGLMTHRSDLVADAEHAPDLRTQARLNEIDRRTSALDFRIGFLRWLVLPVFGLALAAMTIGLVLGLGAPQDLLAGIIGLVGGAAGFIHWMRQTTDEVLDLRGERDSVMGELSASSGISRAVDPPGP